MSKRPPLVAGNWKMNLVAAEARELAAAVAAAARELPGRDVAVFPSALLVAAVREVLDGTAVTLGAQSCHEAAKGAHTGESSVAMIRDAGCTAVLAGHSERRAAGATDTQVARRVRAAIDAGLHAVACVGETLEERESGATESVLARQLGAITDVLTEADLPLFDLAYEPVWAIGTGKTATPDIAAAAHRLLRDGLNRKFGAAGAAPRILYGGSVKPGNAEELMAAADVGGVLVGGAALDGASFRAIIEAAPAAAHGG